MAGIGLGLAIHGFAGIPKSLTHFTTEAGAAGIARSGGVINASRTGLFGGGTYASSIGRFPINPFVPSRSKIPVIISDTSGFVRAFPGTYLNPTTGGAIQLGLINIGIYAPAAYAVKHPSDCNCGY